MCVRRGYKKGEVGKRSGKMDHFEFYGTNRKPGGLFFLKKGVSTVFGLASGFYV